MHDPSIDAVYSEYYRKVIITGSNLPYSIGVIRVDLTKEHYVWIEDSPGVFNRYQIVPDPVVNLSDLLPELTAFLDVSSIPDVVQGVEYKRLKDIGAAAITVTLTNETPDISHQIEISDSPLARFVGQFRLVLDGAS